MSFGRPLARRPFGSLRRAPRRARRPSVPRAGGSARLRMKPVLSSRRTRRLMLAAIVLGGLLLGGWLWLRDSSLVAVTRVKVAGANGPDAGAIRSALVGAARGMTTLDVNMSQLRSAVSPFPVVADLRVSTQFPHGMRIRVIERPPVATVSVAGRTIAVASDGTLLHDLTVKSPLPVVPLPVPPGGPRLTGAALEAIKLLAAAPRQLLARISQVTTMPGHGLVAKMSGGPTVYFGDASRARAKWIAASAVLADPGSAGAAYIDVTDPIRPAAGAGVPSNSASASGSSASSDSTGATGASGNTGAGASGNSGAAASGNSGAAASGNSGAGATGNTGSAATGNTGAGSSGTSGG